MSQSIYCNPSLVIDNTEIPYEFSFKVSEKGNNSVNKATITISSTKLNYTKLFDKDIAIYLNYGSIDNVPIFRGSITNITPSDTNLKIVALDPRRFLSGDNTPNVNTTDYEGHTLAQFTHDWIKYVVNKDKVRIGLDMLNETTPVQPFFTDVPFAVVAKAYDIIKKGISLNRDKEASQFKRYEVVMIDDGTKSNIHFIKDKDLNGPAACVFSDTDGIIGLRYKKEPLPTFCTVGGVRYQIGSQPNGPVILNSDYLPDLEAYAKQPAAIQDMVIQQLEMKRVWNEKLITINASKGAYLSIGDIVLLDVEDADIHGKHKVTGKSIGVKSNGGMQIVLILSKRVSPLD